MPRWPSSSGDTPTPSPASAAAGNALTAPVVAWLRRHGVTMPTPLRHALVTAATAADEGVRASAARVAQAQAEALCADMRERERRALLRLVGRTPDAWRRAQESCGMEASSSSSEEDHAAPPRPPAVTGGAWPSESVRWLVDIEWPSGAETLRAKYEPNGPRRRKSRPCSRVFVQQISDPSHPACGQCGLFAAVTLAFGARVCDYVGQVFLPPPPDAEEVGGAEVEDNAGGTRLPVSDYELDFGEQSELSLDAAHAGNEGRFVNDFRNTGKAPNVEFTLRRDRKGALRQGIVVCAKGGVAAGHELLVSYGKPYWRSRVGSLDAFVTRRPESHEPSRSAFQGPSGACILPSTFF
ncbi:hypothetical protein T492DRAFT_1063771 [Pavlovales sp. CCMP2436]|nr:hypothetical protein T492DRAFT_1063771 [Pavlovales sp. CCMP2436]